MVGWFSRIRGSGRSVLSDDLPGRGLGAILLVHDFACRTCEIAQPIIFLRTLQSSAGSRYAAFPDHHYLFHHVAVLHKAWKVCRVT